MTGGVVSTNSTITSKWVSTAELPAASAAEHVTVVRPSGNQPGSGTHEAGWVGSASSDTSGGVYSTSADVVCASCVTTCTSPWPPMIGGVLSMNSPITSKWLSTAWFPAASTAEQVTVVWPSGNELPETGVHVAR